MRIYKKVLSSPELELKFLATFSYHEGLNSELDADLKNFNEVSAENRMIQYYKNETSNGLRTHVTQKNLIIVSC